MLKSNIINSRPQGSSHIEKGSSSSTNLSVPDEGYSRNVLWTRQMISTFLLCISI